MELLNVIKRYFIAGTDTEVGKTIASIALLRIAQLEGFTTAGYKPVASGSRMTAEGLRNNDALALQRNSSIIISYESVSPYNFTEPTSPHIVSLCEKQPISTAIISSGLRALEKKVNWILIEGAGGWFTPLTDKITFADWVIKEQLPVILVVGIKLGCINHALLTSLAIRQGGLHLAGWIANNLSITPIKRYNEYLATLKQMLSAPFIGEIPWVDDTDDYKSLINYLSLKDIKI